jgi:hypothetical protein
LSLAAVLDGMSRKAVAEIGAMDRQTYPEALNNGKASGPIPKLSAEQKQELKRIVEIGPDPGRDGVVRWRDASSINRRASPRPYLAEMLRLACYLGVQIDAGDG